MRASAGGYYANLMRMYRHLNIPLHPIRFLFVFSEALSMAAKGVVPEGGASDSQQRSYFVHASNLHQMPPPWPGQRGVIPHLVEIMYLIMCQFWFSVACFVIPPMTTESGGGESVAEYVERIWLPRRYISHYLLPLMSSVSTCTHAEILQFPASDLVNYKKLSHGQQHYAVCGGVSQVQNKLSEGLDDLRLGSRVSLVAPKEDHSGVVVKWQAKDAADKGVFDEQVFDRVVLAVSPDVAARIFEPLASVASKIPTTQVETSVLGLKGGYSIFEGSEKDDVSAGCMHHGQNGSPAQTITLRTRFADKGSRTEALHAMPSGVVVSTCPLDSHGPPKNALQYAKFTRTLRTPQSRAVVEKMMGRMYPEDEDGQGYLLDECQWINGHDNVWIAGAWCWDGMVLLEGCVVSAMQVARDFGVEIPWAGQ